MGNGTKPETKDVQPVIEEKKSEISSKKMLKKERSREDGRQAFVNYAYQIGGEELVYLIECENATRTQYRQSEFVKNGIREKSFGFCQISQIYHPEIVNTDKFRNDPFRQLDQCNKLMNGGTAFYGRDRIIKGQKCSKYVQSRFYFE